MNKIGILTYQNTLNYGAMLQAYALYKYIHDLNEECEIINYINEKIEKDEYKYTKIDYSNFKKFLLSLFLRKSNINKKKKFVKFFNEKMKCSKPIDFQNRTQMNNIYDKIIVGSDQVWNMNLNGEDYTYMLDFIEDDNKKFTYAASFGYSEIPKNYLKKTVECLKKFNNLYVREESGKKMIDEICNRDAQVTVDPTFLLDKNEWLEIISDSSNKYGKYILLYMVDLNKYKNIIFDFAKKNNCKIVAISNSLKDFNKITYVRDASPSEFLNLIKNSFCVFTGSFHAVSLSINLQSNFYYMSNKNGKSSRVKNILKISNLESRELTNSNFDFEKIDYDNLKNDLNKEIEKSKKLLTEIVNRELV